MAVTQTTPSLSRDQIKVAGEEILACVSKNNELIRLEVGLATRHFEQRQPGSFAPVSSALPIAQRVRQYSSCADMLSSLVKKVN